MHPPGRAVLGDTGREGGEEGNIVKELEGRKVGGARRKEGGERDGGREGGREGGWEGGRAGGRRKVGVMELEGRKVEEGEEGRREEGRREGGGREEERQEG